MKYGILVMILTAFLLAAPGALQASDPVECDCGEIAARLEAQESKLSGDLRRIQREIAGLRADLDEPGITEVFAGIGYILGIFGTAAFVAARRRKE